jgi:hypothetical protein
MANLVATILSPGFAIEELLCLLQSDGPLSPDVWTLADIRVRTANPSGEKEPNCFLWTHGIRSNAPGCVRRALTLEGPSSDAFHPSSQLAEGGAMVLRNVA